MHLLAHGSVGQKSEQDQWGSLFKISEGQHQGVDQAAFVGHPGEESASQLIKIISRILLPATIGVRSLCLCWL